jgi:O-palmitoleoyl-L-serine hydrolase
MIKYFLPFFILIFSYFVLKEFEFYDVIELPQTSDARCLDGTNYKFFIQEGKDEGKNNFLIFFDGGGWCSNKVYNSTLESCYQRTKTYLGSSESTLMQKISKFTKKQVFLKRLMNLLSSDKTDNPIFHNWNKIFLSYCDGRGFVGGHKEPIEYNNKSFYFRGYNNTLAVLNYIKEKFDFKNTKKVVISGVSAGGHASLYYSNFIKDFFPAEADVRTISDSGFFMDVDNPENPKYNFRQIWKDFLKIDGKALDTNATTSVSFFYHYKDFVPEYFYDKIKIPVLIIHSEYDGFTLCNLIGKCHLSLFHYGYNTTNPIYEKNRQRLLSIFYDIKKNKPDWGIFSPACKVHDFVAYSNNWDSDNVKVNGMNVKEAILLWMNTLDFNTVKNSTISNFNFDEKPWPENKQCAYTKDTFYLIEYFGILTDIF